MTHSHGPSSRPEPLLPPARAITGRSVLVVDDDPLQRKLTSVRISHEGLRVFAAANATEALAIARRERPDAILSDVVMGEIDGFNFCRMVRSDPSLANVPVVLISSHFQKSCDSRLAKAVGAAALVERTPDFRAELAALLRSLQEAPTDGLASAPALPELYARSVASELTRMAHDTRAIDLKYRALFENASDAISIIDPTGRVLDVNRRWEVLLRRSRADIVGRHISELSAPGHSQRNTELYEEARRIGNAVQLVALERADGSVAHVEVSTVTVEVNGEVTTFAIGRDMTETVEAKRKLERSERQYRSLVEHIPDIVWSMTRDCEVTFVSPNVVQITGYTFEELQAISRLEHDPFWGVHPDDRAAVSAAIAALSKDGVPVDMELRARHKDGTFRWMHARAAPIYDERGEVERVDGIHVDITERKHLEEQVRRAQKLEAIGQLTGGVAHDFNNILAVILGNVHFLLDALGEDDPRRADADDIRQAAERAAALTRQLLAFSRQQVVAQVVLDVGTVAVGLESMLRRLISEDIELTIDAQPAAGKVRADTCQIEQVLMNLAVNARDAMPGGGALRIETAAVEVAAGSQVCVGTGAAFLPPGGYVRLSVRDTGSGMDEHVKQHIFEPFFTTKGLGKGTGLGLSTCYGIVQQSHGFIGVDSTPGQGTSFHVYLPRIDERESASAPRATSAKTTQCTETVLLIEDDPALRKTLQRALDARGYRTLVAGSGREAFAMVAKERGAVDLVLSDVVLPDIDGFEVTEQLQALMSRAKFVLMSGHTDHALLENRALLVGPTFMQKPFTPEEMTLKLRSVLDA